jgi:hypothetical protein
VPKVNSVSQTPEKIAAKIPPRHPRYKAAITIGNTYRFCKMLCKRMAVCGKSCRTKLIHMMLAAIVVTPVQLYFDLFPIVSIPCLSSCRDCSHVHKLQQGNFPPPKLPVRAIPAHRIHTIRGMCPLFCGFHIPTRQDARKGVTTLHQYLKFFPKGCFLDAT